MGRIEGTTLVHMIERLKATRAALESQRMELLKQRRELLQHHGDQLRALADFHRRRVGQTPSEAGD